MSGSAFNRTLAATSVFMLCSLEVMSILVSGLGCAILDLYTNHSSSVVSWFSALFIYCLHCLLIANIV